MEKLPLGCPMNETAYKKAALQCPCPGGYPLLEPFTLPKPQIQGVGDFHYQTPFQAKKNGKN